MTGREKLSRRQALARLGLGVTVAYVAPTLLGLSEARASSAPSPPSSPSAPSPASPASRPSAPSTALPPSSPSGPSESTKSTSSGSSSASTPGVSGPSSLGKCQVVDGTDGVRISRNDYKHAQRAIRKGEARSLKDILNVTNRQYPGRPVRVGFSVSGPEPRYRIQIITTSGDVLSVTVLAKSGEIINARKC